MRPRRNGAIVLFQLEWLSFRASFPLPHNLLLICVPHQTAPGSLPSIPLLQTSLPCTLFDVMALPMKTMKARRASLSDCGRGLQWSLPLPLHDIPMTDRSGICRGGMQC